MSFLNVYPEEQELKNKNKKRKRRKEKRNEKKNKRAIFINVSKEIKSHRFKTKHFAKKDNFNFNIKPAVKLQTPVTNQS